MIGSMTGSMTQPPNTVNWLYVDLNSYFASVEQHLNPKLRGKPVAVVPMITNSTSVIAASYEAKKFGIKTGTMVSDAKKMCRGLILVAGNHREYVKYHKEVIAAVEDCHPVHSVLSIDEVACHLRGRDQQLANATQLAQEIKNKIWQKVGTSFSCSIGLAPNRFLAKIASDMQKPNGLTSILMQDLPHKLFTLQLRDLIGIGSRMEARILARGIRTVEELCRLSMEDMRKIWGGVLGERFYKWLRGEDLWFSHNKNQSISHQHVLPPKYRNPKGARQVGQRLLNKAAVRLRKLNLWTRHLTVIVKHTDRRYAWGELQMIECQDTFTLQKAFDQIWSGLQIGAALKITVSLTHILHDSERTLSFFENTKHQKLSSVMDSLNERYGKNTLHLGSVHEVQDAAPLRIAFSNIPDADI